MAIEILKEPDPKKVEAWDRLHDKRNLYRCERCGATVRNKAAHEAKVQPDDMDLIIKLTAADY